MRIERLTESRIKITLTTADLSGLDINIEQLTPNSKELHAFLFHIMETIREKTDFNPYSGQVVVEATPHKDGISIIVSKLQPEKRHMTREQFGRISSIKPKIKNSLAPARIYYFDDFQNLCDALVRLREETLVNSDLYRDQNDYCVILNNRCAATEEYILGEFASNKSSYPMQAEHIMEHWTEVACGEGLRKMAEGITGLR